MSDTIHDPVPMVWFPRGLTKHPAFRKAPEDQRHDHLIRHAMFIDIAFYPHGYSLERLVREYIEPRRYSEKRIRRLVQQLHDLGAAYIAPDRQIITASSDLVRYEEPET